MINFQVMDYFNCLIYPVIPLKLSSTPIPELGTRQVLACTGLVALNGKNRIAKDYPQVLRTSEVNRGVAAVEKETTRGVHGGRHGVVRQTLGADGGPGGGALDSGFGEGVTTPFRVQNPDGSPTGFAGVVDGVHDPCRRRWCRLWNRTATRTGRWIPQHRWSRPR